ncbi:MAG: hypothetical protein ACLTKE_14755 [Coprococcus sp.]
MYRITEKQRHQRIIGYELWRRVRHRSVHMADVGESTFVSVFRSVGIPARQVYVPLRLTL